MISTLIIILYRPGVSGVYSIYRVGTHYLSHYLLPKSLKHYSVFLVELTYIIMPQNKHFLHTFHSEILASIKFIKNKILSPGLESNHTLKCGSDNFPK